MFHQHIMLFHFFLYPFHILFRVFVTDHIIVLRGIIGITLQQIGGAGSGIGNGRDYALELDITLYVKEAPDPQCTTPLSK